MDEWRGFIEYCTVISFHELKQDIGIHCTNFMNIMTLSGGTELAWVSEKCVCVCVQKVTRSGKKTDIEVMLLEVRLQNNRVLFLIAYHIKEQLHFSYLLQDCYNKALFVGYNYIIITGDLNANPTTPHG